MKRSGLHPRAKQTNHRPGDSDSRPDDPFDQAKLRGAGSLARSVPAGISGVTWSRARPRRAFTTIGCGTINTWAMTRVQAQCSYLPVRVRPFPSEIRRKGLAVLLDAFDDLRSDSGRNHEQHREILTPAPFDDESPVAPDHGPQILVPVPNAASLPNRSALALLECRRPQTMKMLSAAKFLEATHRSTVRSSLAYRSRAGACSLETTNANGSRCTTWFSPKHDRWKQFVSASSDGTSCAVHEVVDRTRGTRVHRTGASTWPSR